MPDLISKHLSRHLAERRRSGQGGFSLVELMVVLLIIAVLLGVAIPTYLGARDRAENRAAQELLSHAAGAELTAMTGAGGATSPGGNGGKHLAAGLGPDVELVPESSVTRAGQISFYFFGPSAGTTSGVMKMASWSPAGVCWMALVSIDSVYFVASSVGGQPGTFYGAYSSPQASGCGQGPEAPTSGWRHSWASASQHL